MLSTVEKVYEGGRRFRSSASFALEADDAAHFEDDFVSGKLQTKMTYIVCVHC
jgi:hypothetical protein